MTGRMTESPETNDVLKIDVEQILYSKNPALRKAVPGFIVRYLKRIVHQDELNDFLKNAGHLKDAEFIKPDLNFSISATGFPARKTSRVQEDIFLSPIIHWEGSTGWSS